MARARQTSCKGEGGSTIEVVQKACRVDSRRKKELPQLPRLKKSNYITSAEFDDQLPFDSRYIESARRAMLRQKIHTIALERRYTMRTEHHGANYLKEQLDNGYPELESFNRAVKLMSTRKIDD